MDIDKLPTQQLSISAHTSHRFNVQCTPPATQLLSQLE